MKNSNIVLTSFLALFMLYIFGILVEIRITGKKRSPYTPSTMSKVENCNSDCRNVTKLPEFKILKIPKLSKIGTIILDQNTNAAFTTFTKSENAESEFTYHSVGDTLMIDKLNSENLCNEFKLELGGAMPEIIIDSTTINIFVKSDHLRRLNLKSSAGPIFISGYENKMIAIDSLEIDLNHNSTLRFSPGIINSLSGKVANSSSLYLIGVKSKNTHVNIGEKSTVIDKYQYYNPDPEIQLLYKKSDTDDKNRSK